MVEAKQRVPIRILDYCVLSHDWHFVVWPEEDGELSAFFRWLAHTHAMRWRVSHRTVGFGPLYQGRFKSLPVQEDEHLLTLCRYVERNPVTAGMVTRAEQYRWGSLWVRQSGTAEQKALLFAVAGGSAAGLGEDGEHADDGEGTGAAGDQPETRAAVWG